MPERGDEEPAAPAEGAATTPALRGPTRSSQPPKTAAEMPRKTKNSVYIQPSMLIFQSQFVVTSCWRKPISAGQATGCGDADGPAQRQPEDAEAVGHADGEVDRERGRRDQPAVESGLGDDPFAVEKTGHQHLQGVGQGSGDGIHYCPTGGKTPTPTWLEAP